MRDIRRARQRLAALSAAVLFWAAALLLAGGAVAGWSGQPGLRPACWAAAAGLGLLFSLSWTLAAALRRQPTVDVIALLALAGTLVVGEYFAGAVVALMLATGRVLERRAQARAQRELSLLTRRAPTSARRVSDGQVAVIPAAEVAAGDQLLVGAGEIVAADGRLIETALVDESALTGEPMPVRREPGDAIRSGSVNAGHPFTLTATARAADSSYAAIVRLVQQARASSAPFVRFADRIALVFVPLTLVVAGAAWAWSGQPERAVAVLVVATPCPLILAAPIAFISGMARAAANGVIVKGGSVLERLASARVMLFDKTGTLTSGHPVLTAITVGEHRPGGPDRGHEADECLRLAASVEQVSPHVIAGAIVTAARERDFALTMPEQVRERAGSDISGIVDGHHVRLGKTSATHAERLPWVRQVARRAALDGSPTVLEEIDGTAAAMFVFEDPIRPDAAAMLRALRRAGIERTVLVTGDRFEVAHLVASMLGIDSVAAERNPADKADIVAAEAAHGPTVMVGDGINDAPALALASVGVAMAARGATASSEAADVVLVTDRIDGLATAISIARRSCRIARVSAGLGMGLSAVAMLAAALGLLPAAIGAIVQEGIDVLAIGVALTAAAPGRGQRRRRSIALPDAEQIDQLYREHVALKSLVDEVRLVADGLRLDDCDLAAVRQLCERLESQQLPHERAEERRLYPSAERALGGTDPMAVLSRSHAEIEYLVRRLAAVLDCVAGDPTPEDVVELRQILYGLYAVLRLHNAAQEEVAFAVTSAREHATARRSRPFG